jgi:hypothetical protein
VYQIKVTFAEAPHAKTNEKGEYLITPELASLKQMHSFTLFVTNCDSSETLGDNLPFIRLSRDGQPLLLSTANLKDGNGQRISIGTLRLGT